jgi:hypothetical protein
MGATEQRQAHRKSRNTIIDAVMMGDDTGTSSSKARTSTAVVLVLVLYCYYW